jgi:hypothetical protein
MISSSFLARGITNKKGLAEAESERVALKLGFTSPQNIELYIYDSQSAMQIKKYGLIVPILKLFENFNWYIGDNIGTM